MRFFLLFLTIFMLLSTAVVFADDEQSAKEGFKEIHHGMKKVTKAVDKNAKKGFKKVHKQAKKDVKTVNKGAKKGWKETGHEVKKATRD